MLALREGLIEVVKASLTGSILGNLLLVLGAAMLRWRLGARDSRSFNRTAAGASGGLLVLTVGALLMPDIYAETLSGDDADCIRRTS